MKFKRLAIGLTAIVIVNAATPTIKVFADEIGTKAIDENPNTHWETGRPNSESLTNEFTVAFKELVSIDKMTYKVRQDSGTKGFLKQYEIYGSKTENGDDFTLITKGSGSPTRDTMEIKFVEADANWASISEVDFIKKI